MIRLRKSLRIIAPIAVMGMAVWWILVWYQHQRMNDRPELLFQEYESQLNEYASRLTTGEVISVDGRGYGIPQYLIDHGAKSCTKHGNCFCIWFYQYLDNPTPQLWYSPDGFDPMPVEISNKKRGGYSEWIPLAQKWAALYD